MSNYRRSKFKGSTFFFTVVTHRRRPLFINSECIKHLRDSIVEVRQIRPFSIDAWVLLPEHMHCIWTLPYDDYYYSKRWGLIKSGFSKRARDLLPAIKDSESRIKHREASFWQRRFWEHEIRSEDDLHKHIDYIHYNPVKHGLVNRVQDWPFSTFHKYVKDDIYPIGWCGNNVDQLKQDFGE